MYRGGCRHTVDRFALRQVAVVLACEERIAVTAHNALDVAAVWIRKARKAVPRE